MASDNFSKDLRLCDTGTAQLIAQGHHHFRRTSQVEIAIQFKQLGTPGLRHLLRTAAGWLLHPLSPAFADVPLADLSAVRGVIIQKALPGRRRASKFYV